MSPSDHAGLPPGPPLPPAVQTALMMRYWSRAAELCRRRYGDVFTVRLSGFGTGVYLADPAHIKTVFAGDPHVFHAGKANAVLAGVLGSSSVLVLDEDRHRDTRRLMLAPFARDAVARQEDLIGRIAADNVAGWPVGVQFPVAPRMSQITLEVILRTAIGATDPARLAALRAVMPRLLSLSAWDTLAVAKPELQQRLPWRSLRRRIAEADELLYAEIRERNADPDLEHRTDALAMLIRAARDAGRPMTERTLRDQLMTLLVAGHDTTATALSWALERLTRHPAALEQATAAARSGPGGDDYLDAVAKETLRVRPVVYDVGRLLREPVDIAGYRLPAGVTVIPAIGLVHSSGAVYDEPDRFTPERMLEATLTPTTWLPFGGGNRRCLGATLAMTELRVILRAVLCGVDLAATGAAGERRRVRGVIHQPHRGARITVLRHR